MANRLLLVSVGGLLAVSLGGFWCALDTGTKDGPLASANESEAPVAAPARLSQSSAKKRGSRAKRASSSKAHDPQRTAYSLPLELSADAPLRLSGLDEALEVEGRHPEREQALKNQVLSVLKDDPSTKQLQVTCGETLCRLDIEKPGREGLAWHEIDEKLRSVTKGEMIFNAEPVGDRAVAAIYLADVEANLPSDHENPEEPD